VSNPAARAGTVKVARNQKKDTMPPPRVAPKSVGASTGPVRIIEATAFHRALSVADPSAVIRSMTCAGGTNGAIDGCGMSKGGINGAAEMVGLVYFADMFLPRRPT
jgi:hypothetical protein